MGGCKISAALQSTEEALQTMLAGKLTQPEDILDAENTNFLIEVASLVSVQEHLKDNLSYNERLATSTIKLLQKLTHTYGRSQFRSTMQSLTHALPVQLYKGSTHNACT